MNHCLACETPLSDPNYRFCGVDCQLAYYEYEQLLIAEHQSRMKRMAKKPSADNTVRTIKPAEKDRLKKAGKDTSKFEEESRARPLSDYPDIEDVLPDLATEYREIQAQIKALEARKDELKADIAACMEAVEAESITGDGWNCCVVVQPRSSIKPELLLEHGVGSDVIADCTITTESRYYQVREVKQ